MDKQYTILVINPGFSTTKIAVYQNEDEQFQLNVPHDVKALKQYPAIAGQLHLRKEAIERSLAEKGFDLKSIDAIACRGGCGLPPVKVGAYTVNTDMIDQLVHHNVSEHASNLGALVGFAMSQDLGVPSYIYDAVSVDELTPIARISGLPDVPRTARCHVLNMRAMAMEAAAQMGKKLADMNIIVSHLGSGITSCFLEHGRIVDFVADDEGTYSPARGGGVQCRPLIDLCYSGKYTHNEMNWRLKGDGGLAAYLGTVDAQEIEKRIAAGDKEAALIYEGMAYQIAKDICRLAAVTSGDVDLVVLTGAVAYSDMITQWIKQRVQFLAEVLVLPGERELRALALGILRVLRGEEESRDYELVI